MRVREEAVMRDTGDDEAALSVGASEEAILAQCRQLVAHLAMVVEIVDGAPDDLRPGSGADAAVRRSLRCCMAATEWLTQHPAQTLPAALAKVEVVKRLEAWSGGVDGHVGRLAHAAFSDLLGIVEDGAAAQEFGLRWQAARAILSRQALRSRCSGGADGARWANDNDGHSQP